MIEFIEDILIERDKYPYGSLEWHNLNVEKSFVLEDLKSSWTEKVAYYLESDLNNIPFGYTEIYQLPNIQIHEDKRSVLEYNGGKTRQIIPYCLVRYNDEYYFVFRENNGDTRLNGKIALLGGHTDCNIESGMLRELEEEADITPNKIDNIQLVGIIKTNGNSSFDEYDVSIDHIGLVYLIDLNTRNIRMKEGNIQTGMFVRPGDFHLYLHRFEDWLDLVVQNRFLN